MYSLCATVPFSDPEHIDIDSDAESFESFVNSRDSQQATFYRERCIRSAATTPAPAGPASDAAETAVE